MIIVFINMLFYLIVIIKFKIGDNSEKTTGSKWLKNSKQIKELLLNIKGENIK